MTAGKDVALDEVGGLAVRFVAFVRDRDDLGGRGEERERERKRKRMSTHLLTRRCGETEEHAHTPG